MNRQSYQSTDQNVTETENDATVETVKNTWTAIKIEIVTALMHHCKR